MSYFAPLTYKVSGKLALVKLNENNNAKDKIINTKQFQH